VEVRRRGAFFNELCVPFELDDLVGGLVESSAAGSIALAVMKPRGRAVFDESHTDLLDYLLPHIRRAVQISRLLENAASERALAWEVLDRLTIGFFVVDVRGRIKQANRAGERMLGDGLRVGRDGLAAELPGVTRALQDCLASARSPVSEAGGVPSAVALPRRNGPPLSAVALPARGEGTAAGLGVGRGDVLLVVTDPSARIEPKAAVLTRVYGLTAAEARVALLLGRGLAPKEVANELGITWNTVRFQLRQVYAKTHTSGQSALVRLLVLLGLVGDA
jgi:DNA-binding CsgD family transcriptional regulator/PAS domain-containing protein